MATTDISRAPVPITTIDECAFYRFQCILATGADPDVLLGTMLCDTGLPLATESWGTTEWRLATEWFKARLRQTGAAGQ